MIRRLTLPRRTDTRPKLDRAATPRPRRAPGRPSLESLESRRLLAVTANPDVYVALEDTPLVVAASGVLSNDRTTAGTALAVTGNTQPAHGVVALAANGTFSYTPTANYVGQDSFTYNVADGSGGSATGTVTLAVGATTDVASVFAGPRLAGISSTQGTLLNAVLGGLVGTNLNLSVADYNGLAGGTINGGRLADALGAELGVTPAQALSTNATLAQVLTAAATVAQADGNTAEVAALNNLIAAVGPLTAPIQLGSLLQVDPNDGSLADTNINALDLATGTVQLFNSQNVATTPTPVAVSAASLGLPAVVGGVSISPQVVEPPVITTGPAGTQFHSAAVRLRIDLNLVDNLDTTALTTALTALGIGNVTTTASLGQLSVYTEVAQGQGTISAVDAIANAVTLQATPGLANVYLGSIADNLFFNRAHVIDPTADIGFGTVGTVNIGVTVPIVGTTLANVTTGIQLRSIPAAVAPTSSTQVFNAPFPQSQTVSTSATFLTNLLNSLATSTQVQLSGGLGALLDPLVNTTILPALRPIVTNAVSPVLAPVLSNVADPLLRSLGTGIGQLDLTVNAVNRVGNPAANADFATTPEGQAVAIPVLANDASLPTDPIRVAGVTTPAHGTAVVNPDGTVTYTPAAGYFGADAFSYTITDANGLTSTALVTVNVTPTPPTAAADSYTTTVNTPLVVPGPGVLGNDISPNGTPLAAVTDSQPAHGTLTLNADGSFTYTPTAGYIGPDSFTYRATDGTVFSSPVAVTIAVLPGTPTGQLDIYNAVSGVPLTVPAVQGVLANDSDPNGLPLTATVATQPAHGTLTLNPDGSFTYTPTAGFVGPDSFTYRPADALATGNPVAVAFNVVARPADPRPPVGRADSYVATSGVPLSVPAATGVLANDTDPNGLLLTAAVARQPAHGTLTLNPDGSFTYTPTAGYVGADSFTYRPADELATGDPVTVTLDVRAAATNPSPPVGLPDFYDATSGVPLSVPTATGVLANDTDPNGLPLTATVATQPAHGTVTLNPDGSFTYTPAAGYVGADGFTYRPADASATGNPVAVTFNVRAGTAAPGAPVGLLDLYDATSGQALVVPAASGVLANDSDPNGLPLTATVATQPAHGTLTLNPDGSFTYTPTAGYVGQDSFTYRPADALATGNPVAVLFNVRAASGPNSGIPTAVPDVYVATANTPLVIPAARGVLANDTDTAGLPLTAVGATQPQHGTLVLNADGSFTYTPAAGFVGTDSFAYRASDGANQSGPAFVTLVVNPANSGNPGSGVTIVITYPVNGTAGTPIVQAPIVSFTDGDGSRPPGSYTAVINWGDGTPTSLGTVTVNNGVYLVSGDHTYAQAGTYPVGVVITRDGSPGVAANTAATIGPAAAVGSSISGRVYLDGNRNGRDDPNEFGIATVVMTLTGRTAGGQPVTLTTVTDASGNYSFLGLAPGTYQVRVGRPTAFFNKGAVTVGSAGGVVRGESVAGINLGSSVAATGYDFAEINRANCRLSTAAVRALLRIGANGTVPASFRPSSLNTNGPLNRYLPTLVALVNNRPAAAATVRVQGQKVQAAAHPAKVHAAVKVQHGVAKPKAAGHRGK